MAHVGRKAVGKPCLAGTVGSYYYEIVCVTCIYLGWTSVRARRKVEYHGDDFEGMNGTSLDGLMIQNSYRDEMLRSSDEDIPEADPPSGRWNAVDGDRSNR